MSKFVGIDISKKTFDIAYQKQEKWFFSPLPNHQKGFQEVRNSLRLWQPEVAVITELKHLQTAIEGIQKSIHQTSRQVESLKSSGLLNQELEKELLQLIDALNKETG